MHRSDRLTGILIALQASPRSAAELAARFEVSRRTIMRDIDALGEIGVPVIAEVGRNGGYRIADGFWLPPMHLTADEATVLIFALEYIGTADHSPLGDAHRSVLEKIRALLNPDIESDVTRNLSSMSVLRHHDDPEASVIALLRIGVQDRQWIAIEYEGLRDVTERAILPERVYVSGGRWYVEAVDSLRSQRRNFRVSRISHARKTVPPFSAVQAIAAARASDGEYHDRRNPLVHVELTRTGVVLAQDHPDFHDHLTETSVVFHCPSSELPYYARELLSFGSEARIVGPPELIDWMQRRLSDLWQHHATES